MKSIRLGSETARSQRSAAAPPLAATLLLATATLMSLATACRTASESSEHRFYGIVQGIDRPAQSLFVQRVGDSTPQLFQWDEQTKYWLNKVPAKATDARTGFWAQVYFRALPGGQSATRVFLETPWRWQH